MTKRQHQEEQFRIISQVFHIQAGRIWEIPECCIQQFAEEAVLGIQCAVFREWTHRKKIPEQSKGDHCSVYRYL